MQDPFKIFDIFKEAYIDPSFRPLIIKENTAYNYIIYRCLLGSIDFKNTYTEVDYCQNIDFFSKFYRSEYHVFKNLSNYISEEFTTEDLKRYFINPQNANRNKDFYFRLLNEILNFFTYQEKKSYTTAFVYIYRILELISFSFPLIYVSRTKDFKYTYGLLKDFFEKNSGNQKGELGFLKSAINIIFKDSSLAQTSIDFDLSKVHPAIQEDYYKTIATLIGDSFIHPDSQPYEKLSIKFLEVGNFIITIRNRFFHLFNRGDRNIESHEIMDADTFFSNLTIPCFSWICVLYLEILKFNVSNEV